MQALFSLASCVWKNTYALFNDFFHLYFSMWKKHIRKCQWHIPFVFAYQFYIRKPTAASPLFFIHVLYVTWYKTPLCTQHFFYTRNPYHFYTHTFLILNSYAFFVSIYNCFFISMHTQMQCAFFHTFFHSLWPQSNRRRFWLFFSYECTHTFDNAFFSLPLLFYSLPIFPF